MIGVFDSGLGGLCALRALAERTSADLLYLADAARAPYGERSAKELCAYTEAALDFFAREGADAVLLACGTVSCTVLPRIRHPFCPLFGVLTPAIEEAAHRTHTGRVAVAATTASVSSGAYGAALRRRGIRPLELPCPLFVPMVEGGLTSPELPLVREAVRHYLSSVSAFGADVLVLGCTHYPLLREAVAEQFPTLTLIDCAKEAAEALCRDLPPQKGRRRYRFCTTGSANAFAAKLASVLGYLPGRVEHISLSL